MILALNIGNTHIALGIKENRIQGTLTLAHCKTKDHGNTDNIIRFLNKSLNAVQRKNISTVLVASVVPALNVKVKEAVQQALGVSPCFVTKEAFDNLDFDYSKYDKTILGIDRLVTSYHVKNECLLPAVVIDFGTATTFNVIDEKGAFAGGIIIPGIFLWVRSLSDNTALIQNGSLASDLTESVVGTSTTECISIGALHGTGIMVDGFIKRIESQLDTTLKTVIATGGGAEHIMPYCKSITALNKELLLEGLFSIYENSHRDDADCHNEYHKDMEETK